MRPAPPNSSWLVGDDAYGPIGKGTAVAKRISLLAPDVETAFALAEGLEIPPDPSLETADAQ